MYLELDKKNGKSVAVVDSNNRSVTYGDIIKISQDLSKIYEQRAVVFILNNNSVGSVIAYLSSMINRVVPLLLDEAINNDLLNNLLEVYKPLYIWKASKLQKEDDEVLFEENGFVLTKTANKIYPIYEDLSLLLTTSGSTGSPKLVRHSYNNLEAQGRNVSSFFELKKEDRPLVDLPINYTMGLSVLNSHLFVGATCCITRYTVLDAEYWSFVKEKKVTSITGVPYTFEMLKKLRFFRMDLPNLKMISQGGGKLSRELFTEIAEYANKTGRKFFATYGQTEGTARMAYLPPDKAIDKIGSIGIAIPKGKIYLIDEEGNVITDNEAVGEMVYEGPNVTLGYAQTKEDLLKGDEKNGVIHTGDMVRRDSEGYIYIIGRKSRFLKLHSNRVALDECESLIKSKFDIECACTGDDNLMKIVVTSDVDEKKIREYIAGVLGLNISLFKVKRIDTLPRNGAGKVLYNKL